MVCVPNSAGWPLDDPTYSPVSSALSFEYITSYHVMPMNCSRVQLTFEQNLTRWQTSSVWDRFEQFSRRSFIKTFVSTNHQFHDQNSYSKQWTSPNLFQTLTPHSPSIAYSKRRYAQLSRYLITRIRYSARASKAPRGSEILIWRGTALTRHWISNDDFNLALCI